MLEPPLGSVFAGYRIDVPLGRGGMGIVYLATQLALERQVALKLIAPEYAADAVFRERFARELRFVAVGRTGFHFVTPCPPAVGCGSAAVHGGSSAQVRRHTERR